METPNDTERIEAQRGRRPRILVFISHYLPGFKVGGPARSVQGLVEHLGDEFEVFIVCLDRDLGDTSPYEGIAVGMWRQLGRSRVMYLAARSLGVRAATGIIRSVRPDVVYLNSMFMIRFTLVPLIAVRRAEQAPRLLVAPRGSLGAGALTISAKKKRLFLAAARVTGMFRSVTWQASSPDEAADITAQFGPSAEVVVAPNLVPLRGRPSDRVLDVKEPGALRVIFLSRISKKKNLLFALRRLAGVTGTVELTIAGPVEDREYWAECCGEIARLPPTVTVRTMGPLAHDDAMACLGAHHILFLPTLSENFGHVIAEALSAGTPVLISDQTSWRNLQDHGAGWDVPLDRPEAFEEALQRAVDLDTPDFRTMSKNAVALAQRTLSEQGAVRWNRALLLNLSTRRPT